MASNKKNKAYVFNVIFENIPYLNTYNLKNNVWNLLGYSSITLLKQLFSDKQGF